jgi:ADP-L-glycero-D-manno-heptose 6-epimerase
MNQSRSAKVPASGLYNLGTGTPRTFNDLVKATFNSMDMDPSIKYIDMPEDIRETYQYYTSAEMKKLREAGYDAPFYSLEDGIGDYVRNYLIPANNY